MITSNMILVSSLWKEKPTFKMIPTSLDCPYNECVFDPEEQLLAIVSKEKKEAYHMLPKLNDYGDIVLVKNNKRQDGKPYAEQRVLMDTFYEYFLRDKAEIIDFINKFAVNADAFDFNKYFAEKPNPDPTSVKPVNPVLVAEI